MMHVGSLDVTDPLTRDAEVEMLPLMSIHSYYGVSFNRFDDLISESIYRGGGVVSFNRRRIGRIDSVNSMQFPAQNICRCFQRSLDGSLIRALRKSYMWR